METRANYVLIGLFTLAVIAAAFGFVYWFSHIGDSGLRATYRVVFDGSVSGLRTGASVLFNGIRVGEVTDLRLNPENPRQVVATIAVDAGVPVRADTKVGLDFQGLTGIGAVSLKGGTATAPLLTAVGREAPTLTADPASSQDVTQAARDVLKRIDTFFTDNEGAVRNAIRSIESFTETLAKNSERIDRILAGLDNLVGPNGEAKVLFKDFSTTAKDISATAQDITQTSRSVRELAQNLDKRTAELTVSLLRLSDNGLRSWQALAADGRRTLGSVSRAVSNFDRNPQRVIFGTAFDKKEEPPKSRARR